MIEKIVTSLEVSRKLMDLGIIQESCFYWVLIDTGWEIACGSEISYVYSQGLIDSPNGGEYTDGYIEKISAFTVTELFHMWRWCNDITPDPDHEGQQIIEYIKYSTGDIDKLNKNLAKWKAQK